MFEHRERWYWLYGIDLAEYRNAMRRRSVKWETVALPAEDFRSLARPLESWLCDPAAEARHAGSSGG
jgi:hypothetical protein